MQKAKPKTITLAAVQAPFVDDVSANVERVCAMVRDAARQGAQVILLPELFEGPYFCKTEAVEHFSRARPMADHPTLQRFQALAKELQVVLPVSLFEKDGPHYYNSIAIVDADGTMLGIYRKSHIPDGPGYEEKFYFRPGGTGFKVWNTRYGRLGVGICWDQWYPEAARAMMLGGADILLYPTAIGSEPHDPELDTKEMWQRAMVGHAVSNIVPVVAANRVGSEEGQRFYGSSFITNHRGDFIAQAGRDETTVVCAKVDLDAAEADRAAFGFFRDRRPTLYSSLIQE